MEINLGDIINQTSLPTMYIQDIIYRYENQELDEETSKDTIKLNAYSYIFNEGALLCLTKASKKALFRYGGGHAWEYFYYWTNNYHEFYYAQVYSINKNGNPEHIYYNENKPIKPEDIELAWWK